MGQTTICADGKSPLSCYVDLLVSVPANLELLLDRDAEAVYILTATPALPEAIRRVERWYRDRQREKQTGGIVPTRRIWTRRDERRVNMLRGLSDGCWPPCRVARYLDRLQPRSGASLHDKCFRLAVDEARRDGTAAVLCPKLEQAKAIYERLISAARSVAQDDGSRSDFDSARSELGSLACELTNWTIEAGNAMRSNNKDEVKHSTDFRCLDWYGQEFTFTPMQAACLKTLYENWSNSTPVVGEQTILESADSSSDRLRDVFDKGKHPAWETIIKPANKGAFQLAKPDES